MEVITMARFTLPRDLYHGKGSLEELKNLKGKKAIVVVGGGSMRRFGFSSVDRAARIAFMPCFLLSSDAQCLRVRFRPAYP